MEYQNLYKDFKNTFPNEIEYFSNIESKNKLDSSDGVHVLFGYITIPFLLKLLNGNDIVQLKKCFSFYEEMANSNDRLIEEVLEFTILESIIDLEKTDISTFKKFMGDKTLSLFRNLEKFFL